MTVPTDVTDPRGAGSPSGNQGGSQDSILAENTRLKQELAQSRDMNRNAEPLVNLARTLWNAPGGKEIVEKLRRGESLTSGEVATATNAQGVAQAQATGHTPGGQSTAGMSKDEIRTLMREELQAFERSQWEGRKSEQHISKLHERAAKELEGYENIAGTPQWNQMLDTVLAAMEAETLAPPDDEPDPLYWAIKHTWSAVTGLKPGQKRERPAKTGEGERRGAIAAQTPTAGGSPDSDDEPDSPDLKWARSRGTGTVGKSFSSPARG